MDLYCGFEKNCNDLYQHRIRTHSVVVVKLWCNVILFFNMGGIRGLLMMTCGQQQNCKMNYIDISSHSQAIRFHQYILELVYISLRVFLKNCPSLWYSILTSMMLVKIIFKVRNAINCSFCSLNMYVLKAFSVKWHDVTNWIKPLKFFRSVSLSCFVSK